MNHHIEAVAVAQEVAHLIPEPDRQQVLAGLEELDFANAKRAWEIRDTFLAMPRHDAVIAARFAAQAVVYADAHRSDEDEAVVTAAALEETRRFARRALAAAQ
jgi:hypothetical protein